MSETISNLIIPYPNEGVIRSSQLNDTVVPENSVQIAVNMNFDRIGAVQTRPGIAVLTNLPTQANAIISLGAWSMINGPKYLYFQSGTKLYNYNGVAVTLVRSLASTNKSRFAQFLGYIYMCNGVSSGDNMMISNGGSFANTPASILPAQFPNATSLKADFISAGFEGRIWAAVKSSDAIYYTDIVQFTPPNTYSFTTPNPVSNYIKNFSPQDGSSITGLFRVPRALLVFKQNAIYRIYGAYSVDPYPAYNVGTYSQESIVQAKDGVYFHHSSGFYKFTYDSQPTEISRRVIDFVKAIPRSYYENISGIWDGFDSVKWSVGPVTVEGVTYSNCQMRYTISTQVWTIYDFVGNDINCMIRYDDGTTIEQIAGTAGGKIGKLDTGFTDFGEPIYFEMIDRWRSYTKMYSHDKSLSGIMVMSENGAGTELQYQTEKEGPNVWEDIDTLNENYCSLFPNANTKDFNVSRLRYKGYSSGEQVLFYGTEILTVQDKGLRQN